ncbi:KH domain-containing protein [Bacillus tianshenii]|nr:KH domain-containing protein [Bacillus tianshenii]
MKELIETIVQSLVDYPDEVVVTEEEKSGSTTFHLSVHKEDMGKVIGKQGRVAKAIRTVVYAAASAEQKRVHVEIVDKS